MFGLRAKRHSFGISFSIPPLKMGLLPGDKTVTSCLSNKTVQYALQMGLTPTRVLVKNGMMYHLVRKSSANCKIGSDAVSDDLYTCPVDVPTLICGVLVLGGPCGSVGKCRGGLRQSLLHQCHSAGEINKHLPLCWLGG